MALLGARVLLGASAVGEVPAPAASSVRTAGGNVGSFGRNMTWQMSGADLSNPSVFSPPLVGVLERVLTF